MTKFSDIDLIIVGLGPVGAVAANLAGQLGFRTVVIERSDTPFHQPRAIVFDAEVMRIFASIGLADEIVKVTKPLGGSVYLGADREPIRTFRAPAPPHELAWNPSNLFYQPQLEAILRGGLSRFAHVTVLTGHELIDVEQHGAGVTIRAQPVTGGAPIAITPHKLIACDGASSTIRKALDIPLDDIGFEERWLVVDTFVHGPMRWPETHMIPPEVRDDRYSLMVCDPTRPSTLIPGSGRHRRWEYMLMANERDEDVVSDSWLRRQLSTWIDPDDVEIIRSAVYRFRALVADRWRSDNIFLAGDAAHQTPPFYGQGMCHGIRDAAQLLWKLRLVQDGVADAALLDSYQVEREPHVRAIISGSVAAGAEVCKLDPVEAAARDIRFREIEAARDRSVAMTDIVPPIRDGVIAPETGGTRLPEFIVSIDGAPQPIDVLLGGRFTLLHQDARSPHRSASWSAIGGQDMPIASDGTGLADADGRMSAWFTARGARWAIIRPDRYVFATGRDGEDCAAAMNLLFDQLHLNDIGAVSQDRPTARETMP